MKKISDLVLHKDHHIIVLNKPAGLSTQQDKTGDPNAHQMMMAYAHRDLYVVHRLDQRVSGVLVFAKTKDAAAFLSKQWKEKTTEKIYFAIVPTADIPAEGTLTHHLTFDNKNNITTAHQEPVAGSLEGTLTYKVIHHLDNFMVLKVNLISGRKHQIRAQLAAIGVPVRGDIKYGSKRTNENGSIDLHAYSLDFIHPSGKELVKIIAPFPEEGLWKYLVIE
ncbi:MAG: RluA family pseudouridine synthase [Saprospiraceae bacterium]